MHPPGRTSAGMDGDEAAERFADLFPQVYLLLHARRGKSAVPLAPQMWAVLQHLAMAGPLTVSECARHFDRAQSVVSETVDALCKKGLLERMTDARDRRRTLVWLTGAAHEVMRKEKRVLDDERLSRATKKLTPAERRGLIEGMSALVRACESETTKTKEKKR
jgi:DNA-binding MarR family transcriptional regulator